MRVIARVIFQSLVLIAFASLGMFFVVEMAEAQKSGAQKAAASEQDELPDYGTLSASKASRGAGVTADGPWGEPDPLSRESAPITGSVSNMGGGRWQAKVFNNSQDPYSVSVAVRQFDSRGSVQKTDSFSFNLKAGESAQRDVSSGAGVTDCRLELVHWRNLAPKKKEEPASDATTETTGQLAQ